tara:strand:+ start:36 stop:278 length:243 start_codon:yes stop_codon:yes gene_type:complete
MTFNAWLDLLVDEKGLDLEKVIVIDGPSGENMIPLGVVVEHVKIAPKTEQAKIKTMLVKIDFMNASVEHYLTHLAQALVI